MRIRFGTKGLGDLRWSSVKLCDTENTSLRIHNISTSCRNELLRPRSFGQYVMQCEVRELLRYSLGLRRFQSGACTVRSMHFATMINGPNC